MSQVSLFLAKAFLDFPKLRLGRVGKYADIRTLSFIHNNIKSKASEPKQMNCTNKFSFQLLKVVS